MAQQVSAAALWKCGSTLAAAPQEEIGKRCVAVLKRYGAALPNSIRRLCSSAFHRVSSRFSYVLDPNGTPTPLGVLFIAAVSRNVRQGDRSLSNSTDR